MLLEWGTTSHRFPGLTGQFWGRSQQLDSLAWTGVPVAPEFLENLSFNLDMPGFLLACITELLGHPFKVWTFDRLEDTEGSLFVLAGVQKPEECTERRRGTAISLLQLLTVQGCET